MTLIKRKICLEPSLKQNRAEKEPYTIQQTKFEHNIAENNQGTYVKVSENGELILTIR